MIVLLRRIPIVPLLSFSRSNVMLSTQSSSIITATDNMSPETVLKFWYEELTHKDWFQPPNPDELDAKIRDKFLPLLEKAASCELYEWRTTPEGSLAEVIVLDQFSRNIYRNSPKAFAQDPLALALAQQAISKGFDKDMVPSKLSFLYMPFMHSESSIIHERAMELYSAPGLEFNFEFEKKHKAIIDRFGRYPHRNEILGRETTSEEEEFLKGPESSF
eukprot:scaffold40491_cov65-Cyclotella_meneghiniana.AAC.2